MHSRTKKIAYILASLLIILFLYILLHEAGHLIVMLSAGATITDFSILTAHVSAVGGNYSDLSTLWLHANGAMFPVIVSFIYMLLYKKESKNSFYRIFSYAVSLVPICSLFAWVIIPFVYIRGNAPVNDDVTMFLLSFAQSDHPLIVSVAAVFMIAIGVVIMIKKGILKNFLLEIRE